MTTTNDNANVPTHDDVRRIGPRPAWLLRRNERVSRLDEEFAARDLLRATEGTAKPQPLYGDYCQVLSWIRHRCPEMIGSITPLNVRRFFAYGGAGADRCDRVLRRAVETGALAALAENGDEMRPKAWAFIGHQAVPDVRFQWKDVRKLWPEAFLDSPFQLLAESVKSVRVVEPAPKVSGPKVATLKAIVDLFERGFRPKRKSVRNIKSDEFAYRVMLEVLPERKKQHNAEVVKRREVKDQQWSAYELRGAAPPADFQKALLPQKRTPADGFTWETIRHLILALEHNEHPWLIEGARFAQLLQSPGSNPPNIDNEPCE